MDKVVAGERDSELLLNDVKEGEEHMELMKTQYKEKTKVFLIRLLVLGFIYLLLVPGIILVIFYSDGLYSYAPYTCLITGSLIQTRNLKGEAPDYRTLFNVDVYDRNCDECWKNSDNHVRIYRNVSAVAGFRGKIFGSTHDYSQEYLINSSQVCILAKGHSPYDFPASVSASSPRLIFFESMSKANTYRALFFYGMIHVIVVGIAVLATFVWAFKKLWNALAVVAKLRKELQGKSQEAGNEHFMRNDNFVI